jgi:hypothetical protein
LNSAARLAAATLLAATAAPAPFAAQELPAVRAAIALAAEGFGDSARVLLNRELRRSATGTPAWVEVLYWRGRLSATGDSAERDFRRVAIEYSASSWADDALLQLAQLALAAGNPAAAYELALRLRTDYPESELRPQAALWAARAAFSTGEPRAACSLLEAARRESGDDVEFHNQVAFFQGRCAAIGTAAPDRPQGAPVTPAPAPTPQPAPADATRPGTFEVQVAATRSESAAADVRDRLARAGIRARIVTGADGMRRVRLGPFATREEAEAAARSAQRVAGGAPFVITVQP